MADKPDLHVVLGESMTVSEFAGECRVSERTVWRWIKDHKVEAIRVGRKGHWRVKTTRIAGMSLFVSSSRST